MGRWEEMPTVASPTRLLMAMAVAALVLVPTACGPRSLDAAQCRDDYLQLPARKRLEHGPITDDLRDEAGAEIQQWITDHPECRP
jgi:hypothetical protein